LFLFAVFDRLHLASDSPYPRPIRGFPHKCDGAFESNGTRELFCAIEVPPKRLAEASLGSASAMDRGIGPVPRIQRNMTEVDIFRTPNELGTIGRNRFRLLSSL
jgi:hypothetical protein